MATAKTKIKTMKVKTKNKPIHQPKVNKSKGFRNATIVLSIVSLGLLGGLIFCATQMKSSDDKEYLALYPDLLRMYSNLRCAEYQGRVHSAPEEFPEE